jgi:prepilin peptidase CpaA
MTIELVFWIFLIICIFTDLSYKKIYNIVSLSSTFLGFLLNFLFFGIEGFKQSLTGAIAGFSLLFLVFILDGVGAGDIKFLVAIGSLKGARFVINGTLYGAILAGIFTVILLVHKKLFFKTIKNIFWSFITLIFLHKFIPFKNENSIKLPYAFFLAIGMIINYV